MMELTHCFEQVPFYPLCSIRESDLLLLYWIVSVCSNETKVCLKRLFCLRVFSLHSFFEIKIICCGFWRVFNAIVLIFCRWLVHAVTWTRRQMAVYIQVISGAHCTGVHVVVDSAGRGRLHTNCSRLPMTQIVVSNVIHYATHLR